ncbi:hypothetical protein Hanom_Chr09g00769701 [Helianthus anomalus]
MAFELRQDDNWLVNRGIPLDGFAEGKTFAIDKRPDHTFELHKTYCATRFLDRRQEFHNLEFRILKAIEKLSFKMVVVDVLCIVLGDGGTEGETVAGGGAGPSEPLVE